MRAAPHNFQDSLAFSHAAEDLPFWAEVYREAFPTMRVMVNHRQDGAHQRMGIDRSIILESSKQIRIDEKVRGRNKKTGRVYTDIALEYWSDEEREVPGWVCKPLLCDYIAYAIAPLGVCYLLPVEPLQSAWRRNSEQWLAENHSIKAENQCRFTGRWWTTVSVCLEPKDLFAKIGNEHRIQFEKWEGEVE